MMGVSAFRQINDPPGEWINDVPQTDTPVARAYRTAAAYVGLAGHFDKTVDEGVMPQPIDLSGVKVWPCLALQRALDPEAFAPVSSWDED